MSYIRVGPIDDLWNGEMKGLLVAGRKVLIVKLDDRIFAYDDRCAHLGVSLSLGTLKDSVVTCSAHEWQYDARTGNGINPDSACMTEIPVRVDGGQIYVEAEPT